MPKIKQMDKPEQTGWVDKRKKTLINLGEHRKVWVKQVVDLSVQAGKDTNQTEIINILVDQAMVEDPESFVSKLDRWKLKAKLADIQRRKDAIRAEEERLTQAIEQGGMVNAQ